MVKPEGGLIVAVVAPEKVTRMLVKTAMFWLNAPPL